MHGPCFEPSGNEAFTQYIKRDTLGVVNEPPVAKKSLVGSSLEMGSSLLSRVRATVHGVLGGGGESESETTSGLKNAVAKRLRRKSTFF